MVTIDRIERGIAKFLDMELAPSLPKEGVSRLVTGAAMAVIVKRVGGMIRGYAGNAAVRGLGVMDAEGNVDIDILWEAVKANFPDAGIRVDIPFGGTVTFRRTDVDTLYRYIVED